MRQESKERDEKFDQQNATRKYYFEPHGRSGGGAPITDNDGHI